MTGAADSRTGGRKRKTRVDSSGGASGVRRSSLRVPPCLRVPQDRDRAMCVLRARERGRLWQSLSSRSLSGMCVLQRMRREFLRTLLLLSLVKAQPHPPTLLFMVLAFRENHVSTATAQQPVCIFSSGVAATATATADSGSGSSESSE